MGWRIAYSHDEGGNATSCDILDLIEAIENGSSVKIIVYITTKTHPPYKISEYPVRVWIYDNQVFASTRQYHLNFDPNEPSWECRTQPVLSIWGTDGKERVYQQDGRSPNNPPHQWAMDWCVET